MNNRVTRRKILVIDDELELLSLMKEMLEENGYQALCVSNGADGIRLNEEENPDLIILDLRMPGMDGIETLRQIRKHAPDVRVIIMTGYRSPDSIRDAAELNISEYLNKPFENKQLARVINDVLWRNCGGKK